MTFFDFYMIGIIFYLIVSFFVYVNSFVFDDEDLRKFGARAVLLTPVWFIVVPVFVMYMLVRDAFKTKQK